MIFMLQCEFSWLWQKQVLIQQQACVLSAAPMALQTALAPLARVSPLSPLIMRWASADSRSDTCGKGYHSKWE